MHKKENLKNRVDLLLNAIWNVQQRFKDNEPLPIKEKIDENYILVRCGKRFEIRKANAVRIGKGLRQVYTNGNPSEIGELLAAYLELIEEEL